MKPIVFSESDSKGFETQLREAMKPPAEHFTHDIASIRTGRASTHLVSDLNIECYGQIMRLKELATLAAPDARLITIQPWDKSIIDEIEKAILASDIGITPVNDGTIIRLQLPMMSAERREEFVKLLSKKTEEARISIRNVRKEYHNQIRQAQREHLISEDFAKRLSDILQKITDDVIKKINTLQKQKEETLKG